MKQKWRKLALVGNPYKEFRSSHLHFHKNELQTHEFLQIPANRRMKHHQKHTALTGAVTKFLEFRM